MHNSSGEAQARALSKNEVKQGVVDIIDDETKPSPVSFPNDREKDNGHYCSSINRWGAPGLL